MSAPSSPRRGRLVALTVMLVLVVIELGGAALYFAIPGEKRERLELMLDEGSTWRNTAARYRGHPFLGYTGDPAFLDPTGYAPFGDDGFRRRDAPLRDGAVRVVVLGGSTTFGLLAPRTEDAWPAHLGRALEHELGVPVDVVNAGVPNYAMWNIVAASAFWLPEWAPDVVVLHTGFNDAFMRAYPDEGGPDGRGAKIVWTVPALGRVERAVLTVSRAARVAWLPALEREGRLVGDLLLASARPPPPDDEIRAHASAARGARFVRQVETLAQLVDGVGAALVLVPVPVSRDTSPRGAFFDVGFTGARDNARLLTALGAARGIPVVSLEALTEPGLFVDGVHLSDDGEARKVEILRAALAPVVRARAMARGLTPR